MLHLYNRATMAHALTLDLDPRLHRLLSHRIAGLATEYGDLTDWTEFLVVEPGDTEEDIVRHVGISPLVDPIDGGRFGEPGFHPCWDLLVDHEGWFEMVFTFGSTFVYVLLISMCGSGDSQLSSMCTALVGGSEPFDVPIDRSS